RIRDFALARAFARMLRLDRTDLRACTRSLARRMDFRLSRSALSPTRCRGMADDPAAYLRARAAAADPIRERGRADRRLAARYRRSHSRMQRRTRHFPPVRVGPATAPARVRALPEIEGWMV